MSGSTAASLQRQRLRPDKRRDAEVQCSSMQFIDDVFRYMMSPRLMVCANADEGYCRVCHSFPSMTCFIFHYIRTLSISNAERISQLVIPKPLHHSEYPPSTSSFSVSMTQNAPHARGVTLSKQNTTTQNRTVSTRVVSTKPPGATAILTHTSRPT